MINTGSSLTLLQESCWRQLRHKEPLSFSCGQASQWPSVICFGGVELWMRSSRKEVWFYFVCYEGWRSHFSCHPWYGFPISTGISLDFRKAQHTLPASNHCQAETFSFMPFNSHNALLSFYLALPLPEESHETQAFVHQLVTIADMSPEY